MCRRWSGKTCLSIDDNNALGIGSSEKTRGVARRGRGMNVLFCLGRDSSRYGPGLAAGLVHCNKARWDLNKTNKSGCCFTPGWLQPYFRLTSQKRNSFIPNINLSFRLYFCYISEISEKPNPADEEYLINSKKGRKTLNVCWPGASRDLEASRETG